MSVLAWRRAVGRPRMLRPRIAIALLALLASAGGAWLWFRDSPLVSVQRVLVSGESGPDAAQIRSALIAAARTMTTLDVRIERLRTAVAPFPIVKEVRVSTSFPHEMRIRVIEQIPVAAVVAGGRAIAVTGDGTLLHDVAVSPALPQVPVRVPPGGSHVRDGDALSAVRLLAAAPYGLLAHVSQVTSTPAHGLVAQLRNGPSVYFGDASAVAAKWAAAVAVLADAGSAGAAYIDVSDPQRPAAGVSAKGSGG
jgi:cell division protein FtsQ